jgi:hypothetical protein
MTKKIFGQEDGLGLRLVGRLVVLLMVMSFLGCVAAIPVVYYELEHKGFVVTAQLDVEANKVFQAAVEVIENPPESEVLPGFIKVEKIKKDDKKLSVTFDAIFKDETHPNKVLTHHDKVHVTAIGANRSQIVAVADTPGKKDADHTSALQIVKAVCDKLGVKYTLVKGKG